MSRFLQFAIFVVALFCVLFGCSAPPPTIAPTAALTAIPTETTFAPTETPTPIFPNYPNMTPEFIPTPTPPAIIYTTQDILREFPFRLGAAWVYSSTHYDTLEGGGLVTTTWRVTDTVGMIEARDSKYAAHVVRDTALLSATPDLSTLPHADEYFNDMRNPQARWLIVDENKIYEQLDLDWKNIENARLVYIFPLSQDNRWYPEPEQRALFSPYKAYPWPNGRIISWQGTYRVLAGAFQPCFEIHEVYTSGDTIEWFCNGIGIVAEQFDHGGTPFGFRSELVEFIAGK